MQPSAHCACAIHTIALCLKPTESDFYKTSRMYLKNDYLFFRVQKVSIVSKWLTPSIHVFDNYNVTLRVGYKINIKRES